MSNLRKNGRAVSDANTIVKGNRTYILKVRKACSDALRTGSAMVACEDEDGDDIVTTIVCSKRMAPKSFRKAGFVPPGQEPTED